MWRGSWTLPAVLATVLAGCDSPTAPEFTRPRPDVRSLVTEEVAARLDANGHFLLPTPLAPGGRAILSPAEAFALARGFLQTFLANPNFTAIPGTLDPRRVIEEAHGRPIDWSEVSVGTEILYAGTYIEVLPDSAPNHAHNPYGPKYFAPLIHDGRQAASLSVAAYATDVSVAPDGLLKYPTSHGGEFRTAAVRFDDPVGLPMTPESAVSFAVGELSVRVSAVPRLRIAELPWAPHAARWRLELEEPVRVRRLLDDVVVETDVVYVGPTGSLFEDIGSRGIRPRILIPAPTQPSTERVRYPDANGEIVDMQWPIVDGEPVHFHEAVPIPP